jgi:hypothetical protein
VAAKLSQIASTFVILALAIVRLPPTLIFLGSEDNLSLGRLPDEINAACSSPFELLSERLSKPAARLKTPRILP